MTGYVEPIATNPDQRSDISSRRITGWLVEGVNNLELNQALFKASTDYIWGTQTQVTGNEADFFTNASGTPINKSAATVVLVDGDRILMRHDSALSGHLNLQPSTSVKLYIDMYKGTIIDLGDQGGGVPWHIVLKSNIAERSIINIDGNIDWKTSSLTTDENRVIANQAKGVKIRYNEYDVYIPSKSGDIVQKDTKEVNPYMIPYESEQLSFALESGDANINDAWFRDLNIYLNGLVYDGSDYVETHSRFTDSTFAGINPHLFLTNGGNGFLRQLSSNDPDIHTRTDVNGVSIATTASFTNLSSTVTFASITDIKNGHRINGAEAAAGIPDETSGTPGTTVLKNVDTTALTATMVDALTGVEVDANATVSGVSVTMDNSGAVGGSSQLDAFMLHGHDLQTEGGTSVAVISDGTGALNATNVPLGRKASPVTPLTLSSAIENSGDSENRPISTGTLTYQRP